MYDIGMANIRDVAKEAGVSPATVSRSFTTPGLLNEETQKRVLAAAFRLGYQPPRLRSTTRRTETKRSAPVVNVANAIGFQFFSATATDSVFSNTFYAPVLAGAQAEASVLGLHLLLHTTDRHGLSKELPRMVLEQAISGMLLVGTADPAVLSLFADRVREIVLVDHKDEVGPFESVLSDGFGGANAATEYLLGIGHRRIGFFLGEGTITTFQDRLRGYISALFEAGLTPDPCWIVQGVETDESIDGSLEDESRMCALAALLQRPNRPTALLCSNDQHAGLALRVCRELGLRVPEDLSLIGFDDTHFATTADPPLTTVRVDKEFLGRLAVRCLWERLRTANREVRHAVRHVVPVSLVIRGSCRPLL